jgi:hypothetical protein
MLVREEEIIALLVAPLFKPDVFLGFLAALPGRLNLLAISAWSAAASIVLFIESAALLLDITKVLPF